LASTKKTKIKNLEK